MAQLDVSSTSNLPSLQSNLEQLDSKKIFLKNTYLSSLIINKSINAKKTNRFSTT